KLAKTKLKCWNVPQTNNCPTVDSDARLQLVRISNKFAYASQKARSNMNNNVVIIGAGQAGLTAAMSLRDQGWTGPIHLIGAEDQLPYQRPPLSKGYLAGIENAEELTLTSVQALTEHKITTHFQTEVVNLDRATKHVHLSDGSTLGYEWLIFATGSKPRQLDIPGNDLDGIHAVRTPKDADALRASFAQEIGRAHV